MEQTQSELKQRTPEATQKPSDLAQSQQNVADKYEALKSNWIS
jgi:hypothetical protein